MPDCYILDVGHGNATVVCGNDGVVVVDAGPRTELIRFLDDRGIKQIEALLISHADRDHLGGVLALISKCQSDAGFRIGHIYFNPDSRSTDLFADILHQLDALEKQGRTSVHVEIGRGVPPLLDLGGCAVAVIAPSMSLRAHAIGGAPPGRPITNANTMSAVILVRIGEDPWLLLPGDLDLNGFNALVADGQNAMAPVVVYPHHGGLGGTAPQTKQLVNDLLDHCRPSFVVFSSRSRDSRFPSTLVIESVLKSEVGAVVFSIGDSPSLAEALSSAKLQGHQNATGTLHLPAPVPPQAATISPLR